MIDRTPRYAPDKVIIAQAMKLCPVIQYVVHPPHTHNGPIKANYLALECKTAHGSRWFGCEAAWINSELRMVTVGFDDRDEVRRKWEVCTTV